MAKTFSKIKIAKKDEVFINAAKIDKKELQKLLEERNKAFGS